MLICKNETCAYLLSFQFNFGPSCNLCKLLTSLPMSVVNVGWMSWRKKKDGKIEGVISGSI